MLAGIAFEGFGQLHGGGTSKVTMGGDFGRFQGCLVACAREQGFQRSGQRCQKFGFDGGHTHDFRRWSLGRRMARPISGTRACAASSKAGTRQVRERSVADALYADVRGTRY